MIKNKSQFYENCYKILRKVPKGKVTTYRDIARALRSKAYRAVGTAMNKNPYSPLRTAMGKDGYCLPQNGSAPTVPCHRVINSDGKVGKFAHGTPKKIRMLKKESIEIENGKIDLKKYGFRF
ncbi:MGMT family protein [Candidatus Pacearchaeota archaeon]|nr:hypothetical protein [uncultured archaeon]MBS3084456.1 MGMT family protein [Candidatus Pacearchaeota archaeon]